MTSSITAIIPAGGRPTNKIISNTTLPDAMLPINGKPVVGYILEDLLSRQINKAIVAVSAEDTFVEPYVTKKFGAKMDIVILKDEAPYRGLGHVIYRAAERISETDSILVYLGDTIYRGPLDFTKDFVVTSHEYDHPAQWCLIEDDGTTQCYYNKPKEYSGNGQALVGVYYFADGSLLKSTTANIEKEYDRYELHHALEAYPKNFELITAEGWYDCGNIENYYRAKIDFLKTRSFNKIFYNDLYGSITKTGEKREKLEDEINWYKNVPAELKVFSPRLLDYKIDEKHIEYTLEYYGYQSLADYYLFNHLDESVWKLIISRLFEIVELHKKYQTKIPFSNFDDIYRSKTLSRINHLKVDPYWADLFASETVTINNKAYIGWPYYEKNLQRIVNEIYEKSDMGFLHGDLCLSNILFDPQSRIFKFIDPRGSFGTTSVYGDIQYDIAKLKHSFCGYYDFIVSDLFQVSDTPIGFNYTTFHEIEHDKIADHFQKQLKRYNYNEAVINAIEALLFISMIPLHSDNKDRQKAMFITGIKLLNQIVL